MIRAVAAFICLLLAATGLAATTTANAAAVTADVSKRLYYAIEQLPLAQEARVGYARAKFRHWVDADGDCRDTRDEVLAAESKVPVRGCDVQRGLWVSYYDRATTRDSGSFDVDHLVPLAEAWDSGARRWNAATRQRFANDLRDPRSLVAVTASSNRSKSDRDPAEWMPATGRCKYVRQWVAVKVRWQLKVDRAEKRALRHHASGCKDSTIRVQRAAIRTGGTSGGGGASTPAGGGLDPRFSTCTEARSRGYGPYYQGRDTEYGWYIDADSDGVVCE
ncbi:MAG: excalibur calcium-binding domain-containing protein [Actinomycetes bacterium]